MADVVLERDLQELKDLEVEAAGGDVAAQERIFLRLSHLVSRFTKWQWVIHGETLEYRKRCVRWMVRQGKYCQARRFAMCGRGDTASIGDDGESVRIVPKGCGARFCPRCSRRYGRRYLSRVAAHLSSGPHGQLAHVVLTQRVWADETLAGARARFGAAWKRFYGKMRAAGVANALATYHVTPSSAKGWHFHCHVLVEFADGVEAEDAYGALDEGWFQSMRDPASLRKALFMRVVAGAGGAMDGLAGDRQLEFWEESRDPVEVVLQYVLRDILQGVEGWITKMRTVDQAEEFAGALGSAKLHRLYGAWRGAVDSGEEEEEDGSAEAAGVVEKGACGGGGVVCWSVVGSMDEVLWWMQSGLVKGREVVRRLLGRSSNKGAAGLRLSRLARDVSR